jgi:predicted RNase H-like HicB family nuclease
MSTLEEDKTEKNIPGSLREVRHCPECGSPLICAPVLECAHCGAQRKLRCFVYRDKKNGYIAECVDLDLLSQGKNKEQAIGKLQEAMWGYLEVAFAGGSTKGLVLRPSPLIHRIRYRLHCIANWFTFLLCREHKEHFVLNRQNPPKVCHC